MTDPALSVCCITRGPSRRVALQLRLSGRSRRRSSWRSTTGRPELLGPLRDVADELVLYPYESPSTGPSAGSLALPPRLDPLVGRRRGRLAGAAGLARRPDPGSRRDALLADAALAPRRRALDARRPAVDARLPAPARPQRPGAALVPWRDALADRGGRTHRYVEEPLYHTDLLLNPLERRREKSSRYERLLPGKRVGGLPLNPRTTCRRIEPGSLAPVPEEDALHIEAALAGDPWGGPTTPTPNLRRATRGGRRALARTRPVAGAVPGAA